MSEEFIQEWVSVLSRDDLMSLSIVLNHLLVTELGFQLTEAAKTLSKVIEKSDRTVREWRGMFVANGGTFPDTLQGKYQRSGVL